MTTETEIGDVWELRQADTNLGQFRVMETVEPWHYGEFQAEEEFPVHADLFRIRNCEGDTKDWDDRQADVHRIRQLAFFLKHRDSGRISKSFSIFVDGDRGRLRLFPEVKLVDY